MDNIKVKLAGALWDLINAIETQDIKTLRGSTANGQEIINAYLAERGINPVFKNGKRLPLDFIHKTHNKKGREKLK